MITGNGQKYWLIRKVYTQKYPRFYRFCYADFYVFRKSHTILMIFFIVTRMFKCEDTGPGRSFSALRRQLDFQEEVKLFQTIKLENVPFCFSPFFPLPHLINSWKFLEFCNGRSNISARIGKTARSTIITVNKTQGIRLCIDTHLASFKWGIKFIQRICWWQICLSMDYKWESYKNVNMKTM